MKRISFAILFSLFLFVSYACLNSNSAEAFKIKKLWQSESKLMVPESVLYNANQQILYVANISGMPTEKNGQGFIAQINLDGKIEKLRWITGLNAPKGMGLFEGTLYVADIDRVHAINTNSGKIKKTWNVNGAKFLNDIAIDKAGSVFITDTYGKSIYRIKKNNVSLFMSIEQSRPNGLFMGKDTLLVGTSEGVFRINVDTRSIEPFILHTGGIDGLKSVGQGLYIVTDWQGKTQLIAKDKAPIVLLDTTEEQINAADFEYIPGKKMILIPTFFNNRVMAYQLQE